MAHRLYRSSTTTATTRRSPDGLGWPGWARQAKERCLGLLGRSASPRAIATKLAIWVAGLAMALAGLGMTNALATGSSVASGGQGAPVAASTVAQSTVAAYYQLAPGLVAAGQSQTEGAYLARNCGGVCTTYSAASAEQLLPAWRWNSSMSMTSEPGAFDVTGQMLVVLAEVMFIFASWIWSVILAVLSWALGLSIVQSMGQPINSAYQSVTSNLSNSGIWAVLGFGAIVGGLWLAFKGKLTRAFSMAVAVIVPLGALLAMSSIVGSHPGKGASVAGSPAWIAARGETMLEQVSGSLISPLQGISGVDGGNMATALTQGEAPSGSARGNAGPNCAQYDSALYSYYLYLLGQSGGAGTTNLAEVSYLWQSAMEADWATAEFGSTTAGGLISCHLLERNALTPAEEQYAIANVGSHYQWTSGVVSIA